MTYRTTFALDRATHDRLRRLAKAWGVSLAEVVRRSVAESEERALAGEGDDPVVLLRRFHARAGLSPEVAEGRLRAVAEDRERWGGP